MDTTPDAINAMAERLNKLERRNRQLGLLLVGLVVAGGVVLLSAAQGAKQPSSETGALVLRDNAGKTRARLEMAKDGPVLQFLDERGRPSGALGTSDRAIVLRLFSQTGQFQTGVALERDGVALAYYDRDGKLQTGRAAVLETGGVFVRD
jgi:hypothetical protein